QVPGRQPRGAQRAGRGHPRSAAGHPGQPEGQRRRREPGRAGRSLIGGVMAAVLGTPVAVRRGAMDLLARREHGRVELERKLRRRGASPELIEVALDRLAEEGLLSESRYLESYIASRARAGYGPLRIREELAQRGLPREAIEQALGECGE